MIYHIFHKFFYVSVFFENYFDKPGQSSFILIVTQNFPEHSYVVPALVNLKTAHSKQYKD